MPRRTPPRSTGDAPRTARRRPEAASALPFLPERRTLPALRRAARGCRGCDLYKGATQAVFGEGSARARLVLVGEMPGDREDRAGRPFVGPAGRVLDEALAAAGIDRGDAYVTNAVKHFKWEPRGKLRLHKTPNAGEVRACRPWLDAELLVALGATAARALFGPAFRVSQERGRPLRSELAPFAIATAHPSSVLRQQTSEERREEMRRLVADLRGVARALAAASRQRSSGAMLCVQTSISSGARGPSGRSRASR
jgi:uracil-DNA glycosylase family protein